MRQQSCIRAVLIGVVAAALIGLPASDARAQKKGGVIRVGNLGEPPALDPHISTTALAETVTNHIYEGLYTLDDDNRPIPMLAEGMPRQCRGTA